MSTDAEWTALSTFLGGETIAGIKMKDTGTIHWMSPNNFADNTSGFTGLPGGCNFGNVFRDMNTEGYWWSSTDINLNQAWYRNMDYSRSDLFRGQPSKYYGLSVRCIKD